MRKLLATAAIAAAVFVPTVVRAEEAADPNTGALTFTGGVDLVSAYIYRGYELQDAGLIYQPYAQINAAVYSNDSLSITPYIGIWNSMHERQEPGDKNWWESDVYGGVDFAFGDLTVGAIYTFYTYPGNASQDIQEFGLKLSYNDTEAAKSAGLPFALKPYVAWYKETSDQNLGGEQDQYAEIGVNPSIALKDTPVSFNFPIAVALSPDGYFFDLDSAGNYAGNEAIGFVSAGAYATYALPANPRFGSWSVYAGATFYYFHAENLRQFGGEDRNHEIVGKTGIAFAY